MNQTKQYETVLELISGFTSIRCTECEERAPLGQDIRHEISCSEASQKIGVVKHD